MSDLYDEFMSLPDDARTKFWKYVYDNVAIGEQVAARKATGETARDLIKWRSEILRDTDSEAYLELMTVVEALNQQEAE